MTDQQQEELKQLILSDKPAYFAKLRSEVGDNPKTLKAIAIVESIMTLADLTVEGVKLRSRKKKRIFSKRNRKTKKRIKQEKAKNVIVNTMQQRMQLVQLQMIQAQPIPKFPKGSNQSGGAAYIGERGKEVVINTGERIIGRAIPMVPKGWDEIEQSHLRNEGQHYHHSQRGNYPYPVDQSTCKHLFAPVEEKGNLSGPWKAKCTKCGFEP
jgi:hypothetical protein